MTIAERIEPNAEPNLILDDRSAAWVAYCLIYDAATEELLGKTCPPPEHLRESLLRLADECLWTPWELNDTWDDESLFDACLDQWTEWYEYGILKEYCRRWNLENYLITPNLSTPDRSRMRGPTILSTSASPLKILRTEREERLSET
ncbi:MAG: hypothetical protein EBU84_08260 [Actinobacteria bacterium]|nr:hypothetical protein [Actinomycetota bacterium]